MRIPDKVIGQQCVAFYFGLKAINYSVKNIEKVIGFSGPYKMKA